MMALSITPKLIIAAAKKRNWHTEIINDRSALYKLTLPDGRYFYIRNITSIKSTMINSIIADRKDVFHKIAEDIEIPMPKTALYSGNISDAIAFLQLHEKIVVKPTDQSHGHGVTVDVETESLLLKAIDHAKMFSKNTMLQQQVEGDDYRLLFIDKKLEAAAIREPAYVIGDGNKTVRELITEENDSKNRSDGYQATLTTINVDAAESYLGEDMQLTPGAGERVQVIGTANIGQGGVAIDVTDTIDQRLVTIGQKIVDHFDIGLCGVDIMYEPGKTPYVIEINTGPSLGLHENPYKGIPRQTPDAFLDWLVKQ